MRKQYGYNGQEQEQEEVQGDIDQEELEKIQKEWKEACDVLLESTRPKKGKGKKKKQGVKKGRKVKDEPSQSVLDLYEIIRLISPEPDKYPDFDEMSSWRSQC